MNSKKLSLYILLGGGGMLGGFIARTLGAVPFGGWSVLATATGALAGIYLWYKIGTL